ncbi:hypothetical protein FCV25MIE_17093 [Fagus crenata]
MEETRYRSYGGGGRDLEIVTVRNLSENKLYVGGRSRPSFDPSLYHMSKSRTSSKPSPLAVKKWWNDPERKRKRRVAKYKLYGTEGKLKSSIKKGYHWVKKTCIRMDPPAEETNNSVQSSD